MVENNTWIEANASPTVFIFVHGILSSSEACWRNANGAFWPRLVLEDPEFMRPSVFVSGYTADLAAGEFEVYDAAEEMVARLRMRTSGASPLEKRAIVFVCHSQGGIVVRQMLCSHAEEFREKKSW